METRCRVTPGGGDPRDSATEIKPRTGLAWRKGEKVRQERTALPATEAVKANPTGSKTE